MKHAYEDDITTDQPVEKTRAEHAEMLEMLDDELSRRSSLDVLTHTPEQIKDRSRRRIAFLTRNPERN